MFLGIDAQRARARAQIGAAKHVLHCIGCRFPPSPLVRRLRAAHPPLRRDVTVRGPEGILLPVPCQK